MLTRYSSMHDAVCLVEKPARGVTRRETRDARRLNCGYVHQRCITGTRH